MSYNLAKLRTVATKACYDALDHSKGIADAVNWGDLSCVSAERCESDEGDTRYLVIIEEAAPDASNLQNYIAVYLATHGFPGVEVMTEW